MKKLVFIFLLLLSCRAGYEYSGNFAKFEYPREWNIHTCIRGEEILLVQYSNEMGFTKMDTAYVVFESSTKYRLVYPSYDKIDLLKANIGDIKVIRVQK